jgi:cytoskeletal protein RodZ
MIQSETFGGFLRSAREKKGLSIADLSRATKIKESQLERLEAAEMDALPAEVFVVGFIKAYSREVGVDSAEPLRRYRAARPQPQIIEVAAPLENEPSARESGRESGPIPGRRFGVALVVFLILIVATLTLSLLLRHNPPGGGISQHGQAARPSLAAAPRLAPPLGSPMIVA